MTAVVYQESRCEALVTCLDEIFATLKDNLPSEMFHSFPDELCRKQLHAFADTINPNQVCTFCLLSYAYQSLIP